MSRLNELILSLCPNGVQYKKLKDVCRFKKGQGLSKSDIGTGATPIILYGELYTTYGNYIETIKSYCDENVAQIATRANKGDLLLPISSTTKEAKIGKASVLMVDNIYVGGDALILSHNQCPGYLMYLLNGHWFEKKKMKCVHGTTIMHLHPKELAEILIPLPPLQIQEEIVRVLDSFNNLDIELNAELLGRKKQSDYYRDAVFDCPDDEKERIKTVPLKDLIISLKTGLNPRKNFVLNCDGATCPYITGKDIFGNRINVTERTDKITPEAVKLINRRAQLEDGILLFASTGTGTVGRMAFIDSYDGSWNLSETLYCIKTKECLLPKYLMYFLYSKHARKQFDGKISKGSVPHLKVSDLLNVEVPVLPIEKQKKIVTFLDKFDTYCNDMNFGLPAEINARKKQFEYYRDFLLSFKEMKN